MSDLISRSALEAKAKTIYMEFDNVAVPTRVISIADLHLAPAVGAVNVVRCRDCKHNEQITAPRGHIYCSRWDICTVDNGFCHMGAKMRGDEDAVD